MRINSCWNDINFLKIQFNSSLLCISLVLEAKHLNVSLVIWDIILLFPAGQFTSLLLVALDVMAQVGNDSWFKFTVIFMQQEIIGILDSMKHLQT